MNEDKFVTAAIVVACHHRPDLIQKYLPSIVNYSDGARVVIVNNGDDPAVYDEVWRISTDIDVMVLPGYHSRAEALNRALELILEDVIVTLDDDIEATGAFMPQMIETCMSGAFVGRNLKRDNPLTELNGQCQPYVEVCHSASRETWDKLGEWPIEYKHWFTDVEMCLRARSLGMPVIELDAPLWHRDGRTIDKIYERDSGVSADRAIYQVRCAQYG